MALVIIIQIVTIIWLGALSFLVIKALISYNALTKGESEKTLSELLNELLKEHTKTKNEQQKIKEEIKAVQKDLRLSIQKVGLTRFNPFSDTGGNSSFVLVLLDGAQNGVVITSLYSRTGSRWYVKAIKDGRALEYDLSKEEAQAVKKVAGVQIAKANT